MKAAYPGFLALALLLGGCGDDQPPESTQEKVLDTEQPVAPIEPPAQPAPTEAPARVAKPIQEPESVPVMPPSPVDLSVPHELLDELHLGLPPTETQSEPLLPPLFEEKPKVESNFQLNGRLLLNEQLEDDYVNSVDGAELQLQYKH